MISVHLTSERERERERESTATPLPHAREEREREKSERGKREDLMSMRRGAVGAK